MASAPSSRWKPSGFHTLNHQPISIGKNVFILTFSNLDVLCFFQELCGWFLCFFWGGFVVPGTLPRCQEVLEVVDGGSAKEDGSIRAWVFIGEVVMTR